MEKVIFKVLVSSVVSITRDWKIAALIALLLAFTRTDHAQLPDDFPIPSSMKVEGVPAIKKTDVEHLFFDPSQTKSNLIWDVDRKNRTLLVTDVKTNIYRLGSPLSTPVNMIEGRVPNTVRVSPNGRQFAFTDDKEDADNFQLYLWTENAPLKKLSIFSGKDESVESLAWDKKGETLFYTQVDYDSKKTKLCSNDTSVSQCLLTDLKGIWNIVDVDHDHLLLKYLKASTNQTLYIYNLTSKQLGALDEKSNSTKGFFGQGHVFWLSEGLNECGFDPCLFALNLQNRAKTRIKLPKTLSTLQDIKISPDGKLFLLQESRDGMDNLRVGQLKNGAIIEILPPLIRGSYVIWNTRWLSDKEIVYTTETIGKPASIESFDLGTRKTTVWTEARIPKQLENKARSPEVIKWKSFDSRQISGYAVRPTTIEKKSPVLIFIHGGPQVIDRPTFNFQDIRFAAYLGITVIHTNIRGSKGFGNEFMNADNGARRGDAVKDIQALINWIEKQPDLDSDRIFVRGESYGGFIALAAGLQEPERIKAVIAEYPMVSIRGFLSQSWIDEFAISEYGDPKDEKLMKKLDDLSPLSNAARWKETPLFLTRGKLDARVPEGDVLGLKSRLQDKGVEVWFIYANEAGHGVGGRYVTAAMYEFLRKQIRRK